MASVVAPLSSRINEGHYKPDVLEDLMRTDVNLFSVLRGVFLPKGLFFEYSQLCSVLAFLLVFVVFSSTIPI